MKFKINIVDVVKKEVYKGELHIEGSKILNINKLSNDVDANLPYAMPGFVDAHVHIESSMVTPKYFANHIKKFGTLAIVTDPHEISNVSGTDGFDYMYKESKDAPVSINFCVPSCIPATPFETSGAVFDADNIDRIFENYNTVGLAEMMNFPGVINRFPDVLAKLRVAYKHQKPVDGHAPALIGEDLKKYVTAGISTDHEAFSYEEAKEKIDAGMKIQIREGSAARNFNALNQLISEYPENVMLCTDDAHPDTLINGHIDRIVKMALKKGHSLFNVLQAASVNAIDHYNLQIGKLQKLDTADFIVVNNLNDFEVLQSYYKGNKIFDINEKVIPVKDQNIINHFKAKPIHSKHLMVRDKNKKVNVIKALDGQLITAKLLASLTGENGFLNTDIDNDILKIAVVNRYSDNSEIQTGFINGFGLKEGAFASSIAHDSHNIVCVGTNDEDMATAINNIIENRGGISLTNNEITDSVPLPVGGLMANKPVESMAVEYKQLDQKVKSMGCVFEAPYMTLAFMSLLVIPAIKIGDQGLFDVTKFEFIDLYSS